MADIPNVWERAESEPERPWTMFKMFRDTPKPRPSLRKWAEGQGVPYVTLKLWSRKWNWRSRILAFEAWKYEVHMQDSTPKTDSLQQRMVEEEIADYERLRATWGKALERVETMLMGDDLASGIDNINSLALARKRIDEIGRRAVKLPTTYTSRDEKRLDEPKAGDQLFLDFNEGPMRVPEQGLGDDDEGFVSASASFAEDGEGSDGEI